MPGTNAPGETLDEARANLCEAVALVLEANLASSEEELAGADVICETLIAQVGRGEAELGCYGAVRAAP